MDRNVLKGLRKKFESTMETAAKAVEEAPDGQWIGGSEWAVREAFQALTVECYRAIVQARIDAMPSASQAAFSPSGPAGRVVARQGGAPGPRADRGR